MPANRGFHKGPFEHDSLPMDSARTAFEWLVTGPAPLSVDGRFFPGLPRRQVPLDELSARLLDRELSLETVDRVWKYLVARSRDEGDAWTVACVGLALNALIPIVADLCKRYADDHRDIHSAVLTGFLSELASMDLTRPAVLWRLRCAALRAGHVFIREALDRPMPSDEDFHSSEPTPPWGHPDFVLARAVAEGAITREEAELIGSTRLEDYTLTAAAADIGVNITTLHEARDEAEARLAEWLSEQAPHDDPSDRGEREVEIYAITAVTVTAAANGTGARLRRPAGKSRRAAARPVRARPARPHAHRHAAHRDVRVGGGDRCGLISDSVPAPARARRSHRPGRGLLPRPGGPVMAGTPPLAASVPEPRPPRDRQHPLVPAASPPDPRLDGPWWVSWWRGDRGSVATEVTLVTPFLIMLLVFVAVLIHRGVDARLRLDDAAHQAARAASLQRSHAAAAAAAQSSAASALATARGLCQSLGVAATGAIVPGGVVTVTVSCVLDLRDAVLLGVPGQTRLSATASEPLDTYRSAGEAPGSGG